MDPADTFAYTVLADVFAGLEGEDNYLAARRYFEKALALNPDGWQTHHRFAVLLQNNGLLPAALEHADQAIAKRPLAEYAHVTAIDTLLWMGRPQEAKARLDVSLRLLPASNILKSLKAIAAFDLGETAAFLAAAKELEGVWDPQHPNTVFLAGLSKAAKGDRAGCLAVFKAFLDRTRQVDWSTKKHSEKRVTSLNLYFMARTLARTGSRPEATAYVDLADRLHSGKRKVMAVDPAFRG
jgi:tetratricopeptide (TPR) repeat protein